MWHSIGFVAESRGLNATALEAFATGAGDKYGLVCERGAVEVSTWHVDALVKDFISAASMADEWHGDPAQPSPGQLGLTAGQAVHVVYDNPHPGHGFRGEGVFVRHAKRGSCGGQWDEYIDRAPQCVVKVPGNAAACFPLACVSSKKE